MFGTGTGIGDMFQSLFSMAVMHYGIESMDYSLIFALMLVPFFMFFTYFEQARLQHKQHKNVFKVVVVEDDGVEDKQF